MAVKRSDLNNPEQDMSLTDRDATSEKQVESGLHQSRNAAPTQAEELSTLRGRIATVKRTDPKDEAPHCADCFARGWQAAVRAIEG